MEQGRATNHEGVYRVGETTWTVRARAKRPGMKTLERRRRVEGTEQDALALRDKLRAELQAEAEGKTAPPRSLADYVPSWLADLKRRRPSTKPAYLDCRILYAARFIDPFFAKKTPKQIKAKDLDDWKLWLVAQRQPEKIGRTRNPHAGEVYAHSTLLSAWQMGKALLAFACKQCDLPNPARDARFDVEGGRATAKKATLDKDELARVIAAASEESEDVRLMLMIGFAHGLRFAELSALRWSDVDLQRGTIKVERSQVHGVVGKPKTAATRRVLHLAPELVTALRAYKETQERRHPDNLLFPAGSQSKTGYRSPAMLKGPLRRCCESAGVAKRLTAHCMRKTANNLFRRAVGGENARLLIGHAEDAVDMTELYSEVDAAEARDAHRAAFGDAFATSETVPTN